MGHKKESDAPLNEILSVIKKEGLTFSLERVKRAYFFASKAHEGQFRMSGEPYIRHPVETAKILLELRADEDTIIAGLLHDVPEDTEYDIDDVESRFGKHVAQLVHALTKLSKVHYKYSMNERQVESLQKVFLESAEDIRVIIIKLSDRLHNMRTLQYLRPDKQQRIAKETLEIYAPLANLFGIYQLRRQLEDLCFFYLQPEEYSKIEDFVHDHEENRKKHIERTIEKLNKVLRKAKVPATLEGRPKHYYSIYQKMIRDKKMLQDIYDYYAIRVVTNNVDNVYKALGKIHQIFKPKPGRLKDYIALPKTNGYQSLHTTVIGFQGKLTEIQIRTEEMHKRAEFGVAAHFIYKHKPNNDFLDKSIEAMKKLKNPGKFIEGLQGDILRDRIYIFSPSGEAFDLPQGSTCLDYIFASGLPIDNEFKAVVNGKPYSIIGELSSGDYIEIIYGHKHLNGPELWWLNHVKSTLAKEKIKDFFKNKSLEKKVEMGEKMFQQKLDYENHGLLYQLPASSINNVLKRYDVLSFEILLSKIGDGTLNANEVYRFMFPELKLSTTTLIKRRFLKLLKRFDIAKVEDEKFKIRIRIEAYDRKGLLRDILKPVYDLDLPIVKIFGTGYDVNQSFKSTGFLGIHDQEPVHDYVSEDTLDILVENHEQLITLFDRLENVPGVIRVQRIFKQRQLELALMTLLTAMVWIAHPFVITYLSHLRGETKTLMHSLLLYVPLLMLIAVSLLLKNVSTKTFPHFEETKYFWPLSFVLMIFAVAILFTEKILLELDLDYPVLIIVSALFLGYSIYNYLSHEKQRRRHLNRLKEPQIEYGEHHKGFWRKSK